MQIDLRRREDGRLRAVVYAVAAGASCSVPDCPQATDLRLAQLVRAWPGTTDALGQPAQSLRQYEQAEFNAKPSPRVVGGEESAAAVGPVASLSVRRRAAEALAFASGRE